MMKNIDLTILISYNCCRENPPNIFRSPYFSCLLAARLCSGGFFVKILKISVRQCWKIKNFSKIPNDFLKNKNNYKSPFFEWKGANNENKFFKNFIHNPALAIIILV